jgi:hypothetical protein
MPEPKPEDPEDVIADAGEQLSGDALDADGLRARGDVNGLLALARAFRSGTAPGGRDMKRCFEAYRAAAELGSGDAEYAVALFCLTGGVVSQDFKEGATRLRAAAERGSVPAKVYLGNLYELGIHYRADPEKADVWYRNAARGAQVTAEPGSDEYAAALAELGCVRHVLALVESSAVSGEDKTRLLQRARAHGYGLRSKDGSDLGRDEGANAQGPADERATFLDSLQKAEESAIAVPPAPDRPTRQRATTTPDTKTARAAADARHQDDAKATDGKPRAKAKRPAGPSRASIGIGAFGYAMLFAIAGLGAGYAATLGARELVSHGTPLPGLGMRAHLVFPIVLALVGVLPTWLVYRLETVLKALVIGALFGGIGWVAWGTGQAALHSARSVQSMAFALAGFLAALLVLGLLGGTKRQPPRAKRPPPR